MSRRAFITGLAGQDGSYLAEHLLTLGYEVYGMVRRNSVPEHQDTRLNHIADRIEAYYGDLTDRISIDDAFKRCRPHEIYNLGAQSHVRIAFDIPQFTTTVNGLGLVNMLESFREYCPGARFYQASSSEMFGNSIDSDGYQRETTPMHPVSPYGCAKLYSYHMVRVYRQSYKLFCCNGILFNHESPRRASNFVTNKVIKAAIRIKTGKQDKLTLGNMDAKRDWGHSEDYVRAMVMILNHGIPDDFCVATGQSYSVRDLCEYVFGKLDLDYHDHVQQDPKYLRPQELHNLRGDCNKVKTTLGWEPKYTFHQMLDQMLEEGMKNWGNGNGS